MFTLKISWTRHEYGGEVPMHLADEQTLFIQADQINVMRLYDGPEAADLLQTWLNADSSILDYACVRTRDHGSECPMTTERDPARMIHVVHNGLDTWYLASRAWILGPDGKTIERIAP